MLFFSTLRRSSLDSYPPPPSPPHGVSFVLQVVLRGGFSILIFWGGGGMLGNWPVFNGRCVYSNYMLTCPLPLIVAVPANWLFVLRNINVLMYKNVHVAKTLYLKFETNTPRNETARPCSEFLYSCICEQFIYSATIGPLFCCSKIGYTYSSVKTW